MKKSSRRTILFRRKRKGLTNYKKRISLLKSRKVRVVVRKSLNNVIIQFVEYAPEGDKILCVANSRELMKYEWKSHTGNIPSAYLTGYLAGIKAKKKNITDAIVDFGLQRSTKGSRLYAAIKGVLDAGIQVQQSEENFPSSECLEGKHTKSKENVTEIVKAISGV